MTSSVNVMMVQMADHALKGETRAALALWHDTICKLAFVFFPLTVLLLVTAHQVIVALFTTTYLASVPIFMIWTLTILPSAFAVDGVLRAYAQTRFLLVMNLVRFVVVAALISWLLASFGLRGRGPRDAAGDEHRERNGRDEGGASVQGGVRRSVAVAPPGRDRGTLARSWAAGVRVPAHAHPAGAGGAGVRRRRLRSDVPGAVVHVADGGTPRRAVVVRDETPHHRG
jgi:hypothetical protein